VAVQEPPWTLPADSILSVVLASSNHRPPALDIPQDNRALARLAGQSEQSSRSGKIPHRGHSFPSQAPAALLLAVSTGDLRQAFEGVSMNARVFFRSPSTNSPVVRA